MRTRNLVHHTNPLLNRVRRHANFSTLFRAATPFVDTYQAATPTPIVVPGTAVPSSAQRVIDTNVQRAIDTVETASSAPPTYATTAPMLSQSTPQPASTSVIQPRSEGDANWKRLENIFHAHQQKQTPTTQRTPMTSPTSASTAPGSPSPITETMPDNAAQPESVQPVQTPSTPQSAPAVVQPKREGDATWKRLENIYHAHQQKQTASLAAAANPVAASTPIADEANTPDVSRSTDTSTAATASDPTSSLQKPKLEEAWPVRRKAGSPPTPTAVPAAPASKERPIMQVNPEETAKIQAKLGNIVPGRPTASSVELHLPTRPRPTVAPPPVQAKSAAAETTPTEGTNTTATIPTEIGPLPADMWGILGETPPTPSQAQMVPDSTTPAATASPTANQPVQRAAMPPTTNQSEQQALSTAASQSEQHTPPSSATTLASQPTVEQAIAAAETAQSTPQAAVQRAAFTPPTPPALAQNLPSAPVLNSEEPAVQQNIPTSTGTSLTAIPEETKPALAADMVARKVSDTAETEAADRPAVVEKLPASADDPTATSRNMQPTASGTNDTAVQRAILAAETPAVETPPAISNPTSPSLTSPAESNTQQPLATTQTTPAAISNDPVTHTAVSQAAVQRDITAVTPPAQSEAAPQAPSAMQASSLDAPHPTQTITPDITSRQAPHQPTTPQAMPTVSAAPPLEQASPISPETAVQRAIQAAESSAASSVMPPQPTAPLSSAPAAATPAQATRATEIGSSPTAPSTTPETAVQRAIQAAESSAASSIMPPQPTAPLSSAPAAATPAQATRATEIGSNPTAPSTTSETTVQRAIQAAESSAASSVMPPQPTAPLSSAPAAATPAQATRATEIGSSPTAPSTTPETTVQRAIQAAESSAASSVIPHPTATPVQRKPHVEAPRPAVVTPSDTGNMSTAPAETAVQRAIAAAEAPSIQPESPSPAAPPTTSRPVNGGATMHQITTQTDGMAASKQPGGQAAVPTVQRQPTTAQPLVVPPPIINQPAAVYQSQPISPQSAPETISQTATIQRAIAAVEAPAEETFSQQPGSATASNSAAWAMNAVPAIQRVAESPPAAAPPTEAEALLDTEEEDEMNLDRLAQLVYQQIQRRLAVERERGRGRWK